MDVYEIFKEKIKRSIFFGKEYPDKPESDRCYLIKFFTFTSNKNEKTNSFSFCIYRVNGFNGHSVSE
ncbi:MAG: hypothetical protein A2W90_05190 [Bacteroidetes bacterium GWF2_42_66]|nr:MAG: hypothetical protein A2W92_03365 [Bacteroidetes bacterium GWA2_42_15]OFX95976.1 MAG: hypothetical protein A2W89_02600 [Bacteroidetes bacterium GWE2_42_39]OFY46549.1 MAG: hypothetical protein A2W90_05190 [Bacteroidetes bacterium GWF2_42_66]